MRDARFMRTLVVVVLVSAWSLADAKAADMKMFDYRDGRLDNGLRVITLEDFSCPIVSVQLWYHVGSKDEDPARQGFAHMFEHMMFRGTDRLGPTDHFDSIRRTGGTCNAYTSFDQTVYHETLPANQLELALWLEAERMSFLKVDQASFDTERKVVEEERRLGKNQPYGTVPEKVLAEVFKVHPYRWSPIGNIAHLRATAVQELRDFWTRYYVPNNATLVIVGAVTHARARKLAERYFGWIRRYDDPPRITAREPMPTESRSVEIQEENAPAPFVGLVYRSPRLDQQDLVPFQLLTTVLAGGNSSRLYRSLVAERQLAMDIINMNFPLEQDGVFAVGAVLSPIGARPERAMTALENEIERIRTAPVSPRELTKARNRMSKGIVAQNLRTDSKASMLGRAAVLEHDLSRVNHRLEDIGEVTADDLLRVAKVVLDPKHAIKGSIKGSMLKGLLAKLRKKKDPEEDARITAKPETEAPSPGRPGLTRPKDFPRTPPITKAPAFDLTCDYERHGLSNGLKILVVPNHEVPFVSIRLGLLAGAWTESKPGTASMAMSMLTKGTAKHTEGELADELETYAISLSGTGGMDTCSVSANCLTEQVDRAMALLAEVVLTPTFPPAEFDKLKKRQRTSLKINAAEPFYIASRELRRRLFDRHPYARTVTGEVEDIDALDVGDLRAWWSRYARPDMTVLIFAGDIEKDRAVKLAEKALGGWKAEGPKPDMKLPAIRRPADTHIYLVDNPKVTQTQIRMAQLGITRHDSGYFTSRVVSGYFGGAFNSRLNETIRVKKGLTYGARGGYSAQRFAGRFAVSTYTKNPSVPEALRAAFDELKRLQNEPPTEKELANTKSYIIGSFARQHETPQQVAGDLWLLESNNLPDDYMEKLIKTVSATTADDCIALAKKTVDPSRMVVVVVGPASELKEDLAKIAPVTVVDLNPSEEDNKVDRAKSE